MLGRPSKARKLHCQFSIERQLTGGAENHTKLRYAVAGLFTRVEQAVVMFCSVFACHLEWSHASLMAVKAGFEKLQKHHTPIT